MAVGLSTKGAARAAESESIIHSGLNSVLVLFESESLTTDLVVGLLMRQGKIDAIQGCSWLLRPCGCCIMVPPKIGT